MITIVRRSVLATTVGLVGGVLVARPTLAAGGIARWNRTTVHVVTELGPDWPVGPAAAPWSSPSRLDLITVGRCPVRDSSCITVRSGRLPEGILGRTSTDRDGLGRYRAATIVINDRIPADYPLKLLLLRHELGHALGFNHTAKPDVMNEKITADGSPLLGAYHVQTLRETYGP